MRMTVISALFVPCDRSWKMSVREEESVVWLARQEDPRLVAYEN